MTMVKLIANRIGFGLGAVPACPWEEFVRRS
jgi:hypothetical protein